MKKVAADVHIHRLLESTQIGVGDVAEVGIGRGVVDEDVAGDRTAVRLALNVASIWSISPTWQASTEALATRFTVWKAADRLRRARPCGWRWTTWAPWAASQAGNGLANAAAGAGHQGDLAGQIEGVGNAHVGVDRCDEMARQRGHSADLAMMPRQRCSRYFTKGPKVANTGLRALPSLKRL